MGRIQRNRRDFFQSGFELLLNNIADMVDVKKPLAFLGHDRTYVRMRRHSMATDIEVLYGSYEDAKARETGMAVLNEIDRIENVLSIWQEDSELTQVNKKAAQEPVQVSTEIFDMVKLAKEIHHETEGAYDITSTVLSRCWGFFNRSGNLPTQDQIDEALSKTGSEHIVLDEENQTIYFTKEGIEISPASLGKGLAMDYALRLANQRGLKDVLIHGGFSSVSASGAPAWKEAWQFHIRNPLDPDNPLAMVNLRDQSFSSSGVQEQHFIYEGRTYGHIIDPRTGWPADEMLSANVIAPTALQAEALSTAFFVMGVEKTLKYCENHKDIGVLILCPPDENGQAGIITSNLTQEKVEVLNSSCQTKNPAII